MKKKRVQSQTSAVVSSVSVKEARGAVCIPEKEEGLSQDKDYFSPGVRTILCRREKQRVGFDWVWVRDQKSVEETRASHFSLVERVKSKCLSQD